MDFLFCFSNIPISLIYTQSTTIYAFHIVLLKMDWTHFTFLPSKKKTASVIDLILFLLCHFPFVYSAHQIIAVRTISNQFAVRFSDDCEKESTLHMFVLFSLPPNFL